MPQFLMNKRNGGSDSCPTDLDDGFTSSAPGDRPINTEFSLPLQPYPAVNSIQVPVPPIGSRLSKVALYRLPEMHFHPWQFLREGRKNLFALMRARILPGSTVLDLTLGPSDLSCMTRR